MSFYREWNSGLLKLRNFPKTASGRAKIQSQVFQVKLIQSTSYGHSLKRNIPEEGNCKLSWQDPCREVGGRDSSGRTKVAMPTSRLWGESWACDHGNSGVEGLMLQTLSSLPRIIAHLRAPGWGNSDWLVFYDIICALDILLGCCHDGICGAILLYSNECPWAHTSTQTGTC